jgi:CheY-like chemotaxis protein
MVFGIIKQHQGWIDCSSEVNVGTRFDVYLPRARKRDRTASALRASNMPVGGTETILLVDDEPMIRNLAKMILQRSGYRVVLAENGRDAVDCYLRQQGRIDLVILDLTMPQMSGREALQQLRALNPHVRVILSSGYSPKHLSELAGDGFAGFVSKPYRPEDLVRTVRTVLDTSKDGG